MSDSDKLENYKKEIRSMLIPFQKGCYLSEFNHTYKELIGRRLPRREFGFSTDIEFLYSMPDVVKIIPTRTGEYRLEAVADEKSKHIQKMVAKQKPSKSKPLSRSRKPSGSYVLPPRFLEPVSRQKSVTENRIPPKTVQKQLPKLLPKAVPIAEPKWTPVEEPKLPAKATPKEEVIALVQYFKDELALDDLLFEYQRMYKKTLLLSSYGFSSLIECIEDIEELDIVCRNKCDFVIYCPESSDAFDTNNENVQDASRFSDRKNNQNYDERSVERSPEVSSSSSQNYDNGIDRLVPDSLRKKLQMVAERYPQGIWASEFPHRFEEVTTVFLDLHSLGYKCLSDLIDDVHDLLVRQPIAGSRKDYIIYSVNHFKPELNASKTSNVSSPLIGSAVVDRIVMNLRKILEAYPEGIQVHEFLHIYSINCRDALHIKDFGFDDLETFLSSVKNRVPLKMDSANGAKTIYLQTDSNNPANLVPEALQEEVIPFDAVFPEFQFKAQSLPNDFDFSKYIPVYTSSVSHPSNLYIHLQGEGSLEAYIKLAKNVEDFYNGSQSALYVMKNNHIKVGASCVAQWPIDKHWYRAQILSIPCMETVKVHYVDYGTKEIIPKCLLRYLKKEHIDLPAQAIRCCLAFIKPAKNAATWDIKSKRRILNLCKDVSLMAKIEEITPDGIYSIVLCDTNGKEDVYINDLLCNEGLADVIDSTNNNPVSSEPAVVMEYCPNMNPLQVLQARYFLQAFAAVAPVFAQNENYVKLLKEVNMFCSKIDHTKQLSGMPFKPAIGPPGFNVLPPSMNAYANSNAVTSSYSTAASTLGGNVKYISASPICAPDFCATAPTNHETFNSAKSVTILPEENEDTESEIFDEDDDEIFRQFCQKNLKIRNVKRVLLGDGYKIHIIVVESEPYASSGDISQLIWNNKEADYLLRRLQIKDVNIPAHSLSEDGNEELFQQLERYNVKGVQKTSGFKSSILLYPLKEIIKILNLFGHPSVTLRTKLTEEIASFNPNDPDWMEPSLPEPLEQEEKENFSGVTDDDKIEKLCLFDLLAMKESITCRRKKMINTSNSKSDEIDKLEQLQQKVLQRIQEIKEICTVFA